MRSALRRAYERFIRIRGDPKDISLGLALGIFFDNGEVDQLIDKNRPGFLSRMAEMFKD